MDMKYDFVEGDTVVTDDGHLLHRIRALRDINTIAQVVVNKGELGGYIETRENLLQSGNCWVFRAARVYGGATIRDDAVVYNAAMVYGNAIVYERAHVFGNAEVYGNTIIRHDANVFDDARVYDGARIRHRAQIYEHAQIYGNARVNDDVRVFGNARIHGDTHLVGDARYSTGSYPDSIELDFDEYEDTDR